MFLTISNLGALSIILKQETLSECNEWLKKNISKPGLYLFKLAGFEVRLDWSWFFLAILVAWTLAANYFPTTSPNLNTQIYWIMGIFGTIGLFLSIILHELCHSLVGRYYGIPIAGITLFIFGGVAEMRDMPAHPKAEFLMAIVGPIFSLALGLFFYFSFKVGSYYEWPTSINDVVYYLSVINFVVGVFNLLPGFPLDGGRVFRAILWWWKGDLMWATEIAYRGGAGLGFVMIIFGILLVIQGAFISGIWMFLLGFFLQSISKMSYQDLLVREIFRKERVKKYAKTNLITVAPDITIQELIDKYFYHYYHKLYPVVEKGNLVGCVFFDKVKQIEKDKWPTLYVRDVMDECTQENAVDAGTKVMKALQLMNTQKIGRLIVTDHGQLYGMITLKDLMDVISLRMNLDERE